MPKIDLLRVQLTPEIIAEVCLPKKQTGKVALLAPGLPSSPGKGTVLQFLSERGFVALLPRYRGTWESTGWFLEHSPADDYRKAIAFLTRSKWLKEIKTGRRIRLSSREIYLFGASFGGPAVLLNSHLPQVKKVICLSPVLNWKEEGRDEPFHELIHFLEEGFPGAYRLRSPKDWQKLRTESFYNPVSPLRIKKISGRKVFIVHAKNDTIVPVDPVIPFIEKTNSSFYLKKKGGHFGLSHLTHRFFWKKIAEFLER